MALAGLKKVNTVKEVPKDASSADDSDGSDVSEQGAPIVGNAGWADSIAKVLGTTKPKTKKTLVLSRAKKVQVGDKRKAVKEEYGFELAEGVAENATDLAKEKKPIKSELDEVLTKPKNLVLPLRSKPTWKDMERERALRKVATKGVVQLFNAVRVQQKDLQNQLEAAGPLDSRRDAVLNNIDKRKFLDVLMSGKRAKSEMVDGKVKAEQNDTASSSEYDDDENSERKKKNKWSVLRPDFMTNKKIKHWDEEEENQDDNSGDSGTADTDDDDDE